MVECTYIYIYIRITRYSRVAASLLIAAERYSLETFRGVGFSSRARGHRKGRRERGRERKGAVVSGIRGGGGGFFCSFLAARRGDGRGGVSYTAGAPAASLLYEILIQGDIRQAYIRLACKSPPYLISRGCDAPGDDGSFYAAATFPSISPLFLVVVTFDHRRNIAVPLEKDRICACRWRSVACSSFFFAWTIL